MFDIPSGIHIDEAISRSNVDLREQEKSCPTCILTVHNAEHGLTITIRLYRYQIVMENIRKERRSHYLKTTCGDHQ